MMRFSVAAVTALIIASGTAAPAHSTVLASSTFGTNTENWMVGDIDNVAQVMEDPTYNSTGGNPGGYISTTDDYDIVGFFAPAAFLSNQSAAYNGTLTFDLQDQAADGARYPTLFLYGAGMVISAQASNFPATTFTSFSITLNEADFDVFTPSAANEAQGSTPVSQLTFEAVLGDLTNVAIEADWHTGADLTGLDNVILTAGSSTVSPVPEPTSFAVLASALLGFGLMRRRRNGM